MGPNPNGPNPNSPNDSDDFINSFQYLPSIVRGSSGILQFPSDLQIRNLTPRADRQIHPVNEQNPPANTPIRPGGPIKHVFYIVKENRTYDQVLGDDPRGDGDPNLTLFGRRITPNTHALARRFPLLDHVYANSEASIDGHYWTAAGAVSDYVVKNWPQNYSGRGRPYDFGAYEVSAPPKGYVFQRALKQSIPFYNYGEALAGLSPLPDKDRNDQETAENAEVLRLTNSDIALNGGCYDSDVAIFNPVGASSVDIYDSSLPPGAPPSSHSRFDCFNTRFQSQLATNSVPRFNYIVLPLDHTQGVAVGKRTPNADVADNDWALGQVVDAISHSSIWNSSLILVMEDDSQDGADHVDAHRIPTLAISPYTKRGAVVHGRYDQLSFLRTAEIIMGMKPLNLAEALAVPLYHAMTGSPGNAAPYDAITPNVDMTATNPEHRRQPPSVEGLAAERARPGAATKARRDPVALPPRLRLPAAAPRAQRLDRGRCTPGRERRPGPRPPEGDREAASPRGPGRRRLRSPRRDVQAHVVERQGTRDHLEDGLHVGRAQLLRKLLEMAAEAHGLEVRTRVTRLRQLLLEPAAPHLEARPLQPDLRVAGGGEVPGADDPPQVGSEALVSIHRLDRVQEVLEVADPAALRLEASAGP